MVLASSGRTVLPFRTWRWKEDLLLSGVPKSKQCDSGQSGQPLFIFFIAFTLPPP